MVYMFSLSSYCNKYLSYNTKQFECIDNHVYAIVTIVCLILKKDIITMIICQQGIMDVNYFSIMCKCFAL